MPGDSPYAAVQAFTEPIQRAIACVGHHKVSVSPGGKQDLGKTHLLHVNDGYGVDLGDGFHLDVSIHYRITKQEARSFKVDTEYYAHTLFHDDVEVFAMHWHPDGSSPYQDPHLHMRPHGLELATHRAHLPTRRMTVEDAIEWSIGLGVTPERDDWETIIGNSRDTHLDNATWTIHSPNAPAESR